MASYSDMDRTLSPSLSSSGFVGSSTPRTSRARQHLQFRRPQAPVTDRGGVFTTCPRCNKGYRSKKYFEKHLQAHALRDVAGRIPNVATLLHESKVIGGRALQKVVEIRAVGRWGTHFNNLVQNLLEHQQNSGEWEVFLEFVCQRFTDSVQGKSVILPSSMIQVSLKDVEKVSSHTVSRIECHELLKCVPGCNHFDPEVLQFFLCVFLFRFSDEFVIFLSRTIRAADSSEDSFSVTIDEEDRQTIHYVAGSVIKGFLRFGRRHPENKTWQKVTSALKSKFIENPDVSPASEHDRAWTEIMSRGALTFVGQEALNFFVEVSKILIRTEYNSGERGLPHDTILEAVFKGHCKYVWDNIIESSLPEEMSLNLLRGVTKSFTHTYGRGVAMKRINAVNKNKPYSSLTLRHSLAAL